MTIIFLLCFLISYVLIINLTLSQRIPTTTSQIKEFQPTESNVVHQKLVFLPSRELQPPKLSVADRRKDKLLHPFQPMRQQELIFGDYTTVIPSMNIQRPVKIVGEFKRKVKRKKPRHKTQNKKLLKQESMRQEVYVSPQDINQILFERQDPKPLIMNDKKKKSLKLTLDLYPHTKVRKIKKKPYRQSRYNYQHGRTKDMYDYIQHEKLYNSAFDNIKFHQIQPMNPYDLQKKLVLQLNLIPKMKEYNKIATTESNDYMKKMDNHWDRSDNYKVNIFEFPYKFEIPQFKPIHNEKITLEPSKKQLLSNENIETIESNY